MSRSRRTLQRPQPARDTTDDSAHFRSAGGGDRPRGCAGGWVSEGEGERQRVVAGLNQRRSTRGARMLEWASRRFPVKAVAAANAATRTWSTLASLMRPRKRRTVFAVWNPSASFAMAYWKPAALGSRAWTPPASPRYVTPSSICTDSMQRGSSRCPFTRSTKGGPSGRARYRSWRSGIRRRSASTPGRTRRTGTETVPRGAGAAAGGRGGDGGQDGHYG